MRERQRDYELMFIISPLRTGEEEINNSISRIQQAINTTGGEVTSVEHNAPWGRRKLAYPIRRYTEGEASRRSFTEGYYVLIHFRSATTQIGEIERSLKFNDAVLRYLLTLIEHRKVAAVSANGAAETVNLVDVDSDDASDEDAEDTEDTEDDEA